MSERITIIGGSSGRRKVSIVSDRYVAAARCNVEEGQVSVRVKPTSALTAYFRRHPRLPVPRVLRMMLFLLEDLSVVGKVAALAVFGLMAWSSLSIPDVGPQPFSIAKTLMTASMQLALLAVIVGFVSMTIAPWHGAEHKTIMAYESLGSTDLHDIRMQGRVHPKCGGRLLAPLALANIMVSTVARWRGYDTFLLSMLFLEAVLWIDALWGFEKIVPMAWLSARLQEHITTVEPNTIEIMTAKAAMDALLEAHEATAVETETAA